MGNAYGETIFQITRQVSQPMELKDERAGDCYVGGIISHIVQWIRKLTVDGFIGGEVDICGGQPARRLKLHQELVSQGLCLRQESINVSLIIRPFGDVTIR